MFEWVHYIWILLPTAYLIIWLKAVFRKASKADKQEPPSYYFKHFVFVSLMMVAAVIVEEVFYLPQITPLVEQEFGFDGFRVLVYPLMLVLAAFIHTRLNPTELDIKRRAD